MRKAIFLFFILLPAVTLAQTNYRFTGQEYDSSADLYYFNQRYYQQDIGRFSQNDPLQNYLTTSELEEKTGNNLENILFNPQLLNGYSYALGNPVKYIDPTGEFNWETNKVEAGDTLSKAFGDRWQEVADYNNLNNPNLIRVGQVLKIPWQEPSLLDKTVDWGTTVLPGASDIRDVAEFIYGKDIITGEKSSYIQRAEMGAMAVLPFASNSVARKAKRLGEKLSETINRVIVENKEINKITKIFGIDSKKAVDKLSLPKVLDDLVGKLNQGIEKTIQGWFR